ncbi:hypothetical protein DV736_g4975, partial [Chaetothyriales sp. CBS 134916]
MSQIAVAEDTTITTTTANSSLVSVSVFDLLLIELIPLAERMAIEYEASLDRPSARLDALGYRVGLGLSERFSRDRPRFVDHLDVIKFLCKDLWTVVWKKQIDNLKTNHRGVFVLTDAKFRPLSRMSMAGSAEAVARAQVHLIFPCGIIRGVLSSLGIQASVQAETTELPTATFQIKTSGAKG